MFKISISLNGSFYPYFLFLSLLILHDLLKIKSNVALLEHSSVALSQTSG